MPSASTVGDSILPHDCWSGGTISSGSGDVLLNGKLAATVGDSGTPHSWVCPGSAPPHPVTIISGSSSVLVNGKPMAFIGSETDCGTFVGSGSPDVIIAA